MTGNSHLAEDMAQEAFVRVYANRVDYEPTAKFSTYIFRVALNLCYDELRRQHRRKETSLESDPDEKMIRLETIDPTQALPSAVAEANERAEEVKAALFRLPELYRSVVVLRHYENLKFHEIAEVLNLPEGTVKSRMAEAMEQLSELLKATQEPDRQKERVRL
jgi:RNA polymerase sigma-70 factor (ECF subfamily)